MLLAIFSYNIKPEDRDNFTRAAKECGLFEGTLQEEGCLSYQQVLPVGEPWRVMCIERWESKEAFAAHRAQPHTERFQAVKAKYLLSMDEPLFFDAVPTELSL